MSLSTENSTLNSKPSVPTGATTASTTPGTPDTTKTNDLETKAAPRREWSNKLDYMMSCIGFAVGLGNIWRFPYLCYKNGGGAFLIPYLICLVFTGVPVYLLESALGQLLGRGFITIWTICPVLKGVGYSSLILVFWLNAYYIVIIAWSAYYLLRSFTIGDLPWATCSNAWNTAHCKVEGNFVASCLELLQIKSNTVAQNGSSTVKLTAHQLAICRNHTQEFASSNPVKEFWNRHVIQTTPGIDTSGGVIWYLWASLALMWLLCYWAMYRGIKTTGKILYVTALFPYFCLTVLFIRGITLEGALTGIVYYLKPDLGRLLDPTVWIDAATQVFFSQGLGVGAWPALSSYNSFSNDVLWDTVIVSVINALTAFFSGFIVFSIIGFMSQQAGVDVSEVAESGSGLSFIVYPSATLMMPFAHLWTVLFFIMMMMLGLGSQVTSLSVTFSVFSFLFSLTHLFCFVYFFSLSSWSPSSRASLTSFPTCSPTVDRFSSASSAWLAWAPVWCWSAAVASTGSPSLTPTPPVAFPCSV